MTIPYLTISTIVLLACVALYVAFIMEYEKRAKINRDEGAPVGENQGTASAMSVMTIILFILWLYLWFVYLQERLSDREYLPILYTGIGATVVCIAHIIAAVVIYKKQSEQPDDADKIPTKHTCNAIVTVAAITGVLAVVTLGAYAYMR